MSIHIINNAVCPLSKGPRRIIPDGSQTATREFTSGVVIVRWQPVGEANGVVIRLRQYMTDIMKDEQSIYEIGYLIVSVPDEKVPVEAETLKKIIEDAGASVITEEAPHHQQLAYTIRKKMVSGGYEKHDAAHFGWIKFELGSDKIESVKKAIELHPSVLRMLLVSTVRENTYLGKRASTMAIAPAVTLAPTATASGALVEDKKDIAPATIEEMDKSIDNMVKEGI